ncbi:MAG TPA: hypothetical protein PKH77_00165 [Anaerolineae bacterium]|nr:hypothetical protein [Anaerolineae bacterium]
MEKRESLGKRLGRFVALVATVFAIVSAALVTQRLSQDSLALLLGLACGIATMTPTLGIGFLLWRREESRRTALQTTPAASPPVVVITPQALPGYPAAHPALMTPEPPVWQWNQTRSQRNFMIVGGEE